MKDADLSTFLAAPSARKKRMATETDYPHLIPDIEAWLTARANGQTDKSLAEFRSAWLEPRGYKLGDGALRKFCMIRYGDLWQRISR